MDNKGETTIAEEHVESFREAFDMFVDEVLDRKKDDFYVWEDYDRMTRGRDNLLMDKKLNSLEKHGRLSETFLTGKYELVLEVQRVDQTEDLELFDDDDYVGEGSENNPRFKCMEEDLSEEDKMITEELDIDDIYENKAWYEITLQDEDGEIDEQQIDVTEDDYWGNINTVDGTCYFPSGEEFDGIGYGNDEDGYRKIVKVVDLNTGRKVPLKKWANFVDSLVELFSDM